MIISALLVALGIALLYIGGELLVSSSISLARRFGVSSMVIGLTVVAFATSAPELAAALAATLRGSPDIAVGNAVGSNIANVCLILGITGLFFPLSAGRRFMRREMAFMIFATVLVYPVMLSGSRIGHAEGAFLVVVLVAFLRNLILDARRNPPPVTPIEDNDSTQAMGRALTGVSIGVALLVGGAQSLVYGAADIATAMGVPERVIGLTLVAIGTSLPELAASVVAGRRGEGDLVLGNIIGSNIFNLLCILGITAIVEPIAVAVEIMRLDFWMMLGTSILVLLMMVRRLRLQRWQAAILLTIYAGYTATLYAA